MKAGTVAARADAFALALQSALTKAEVAHAYLENVPTVIDANAVGLYQLDRTSRDVVDANVASAGDFLNDYESYGRSDDPVLHHVLNTGTAIDSSRLPTKQWGRCGARQALAVAGLEHSMEAPVVAAGVLFGTINFARDVNLAPFSRVDLTAAETIARHLGRAIERAMRYELTAQRSHSLEHTMERLEQPVIITDWDGRIMFRNKAARESCPMSMSEDGQLTIAGPLSRAILDATAMFVRDEKRVVMRTIRTTGTKQMVVRTYRLSDATRASATLLFERAAETTGETLPQWEVLTRREQQISQLVSQGLTTRQIAERAFISENTVKQHLKRIYAKTDVSNRAELIQLIWASTATDARWPSSRTSATG